MPAIGSVNVRISASTMGLNKGLSSASSSISSFGSSMLSMASGVGLATAGLFGFTAAMDVVSSAVERASNMEQAEIAFGVLFKSVSTAKTVLSGLSDFAAETPFELPELTSAAKSLAAFGIAANDVVPELRMLGDISAGIGAPITEIATLYGKANVQGRLFAKDISELTGRGIPVIGELAKQFGVAENKVQDLVTEGKIGFPEVQKAFQAMTGSGGQFEKLMEKQSKSLGGIWSTLKDNIGLTLSGIATDLIAAFDVKALLTKFIGFTGMIKDGMKSITPVIQAVASVFGTAWDVYVSYATGIFQTFGATTSLTFTSIRDTAISALEWIKSGLEALKPIATTLGNVVGATWATIAAGARTAFDFIVLASSTLYNSVASVFTAIGSASGATFASIGATAFDAVTNTIGFFFNLGDNLKSIWTWLGANWANLLTDMVSATLTFAGNSLKNFATLFKGMFRIVTVWQGWTIGLFKRLFSFEIMDAVLTGLISIGTAIRDWASAAWDSITSIFSGDAPSGALDNFITQAKSDLQMGMDNIDITASLGTVLSETANDLVKPLDGFKSTLTDLPEIKVDIPGLKKDLKPAITSPTIPSMPTPPTMAPGPAVATAGGNMVETKVKPLEAVAGLNRSSSDAFSAVFKAQRGEPIQDKILKTNEKQLAETKQVRKNLDKMTNGDGIQWVAGEVIV